MMEMVVTSGATRHTKLQFDHHHQVTSTQPFTGWMPFLSPNQQVKALWEKVSRSPDLITTSLAGSLPTFSDH